MLISLQGRQNVHAQNANAQSMSVQAKPVAKMSVLKADTVSFSANLDPAAKLEATRAHYQKALREGYGLPALNVNNLEQLHGITAAALKKQSPMIIQASKGAWQYAGQGYIIKMVEAAREDFAAKAKEQGVKVPPTMLHLDHGDVETAKKCVDAGFDSVMIDASKEDFETNIAMTKEVVDYAHKRGVFVEAELGKLAGVEDGISNKKSLYTDPQEAAEFVRRTRCDSLAISIGTSHGPVKFKDGEKPELDFKRLSQIKEAVEQAAKEEGIIREDEQYPFVLHGASSSPKDLYDQANKFVVLPRALVKVGQAITDAVSPFMEVIRGKGIPEEMYTEAVKRGIAKVNIDSDFRVGVLAAIKDAIAAKPTEIDPRKYVGAAKGKIQEIAERKMDVLQSTGKA